MTNCHHCRHYVNDIPFTHRFGKCRMSRKIVIERHRGTPNDYIEYASVERKRACGPDASMFELEDSPFKRFRNSHGHSLDYSLRVFCLLLIYADLMLLLNMSRL